MRNAKKTISLVMIAIFTTFIVLSGIPAGAVVTTAQAKAQVTKATNAVVTVEKTVKVVNFNPTTATTQLATATKEVAKVKSLGKTYTKTYTALSLRNTAVGKKIAARKLAIANAAKALAKLFTDAENAVAAAEKATSDEEVDLVTDEAALGNAQGAVTAALEFIVKLDKNSSNYKGLMARVDTANNLIVKAMDEKAAILAAEEAAKAAEEAAKVAAAAAKATEDAATVAVKALEDAKLVTADDAAKAKDLSKAAVTAVAAVKDAEKAATFTASIKKADDKIAALVTKLEADAKAAEELAKVATVASVSAVDGTVTVTFDKKPATAVAVGDFLVTRSINGTAAEVTPTAVTVINDTKVTLSVPPVPAVVAEQAVVYSVKYSTGAVVAAAAFTLESTVVAVNKITALNPIKGYTDVVLLGSPALLQAKIAPNATAIVTITDNVANDLEIKGENVLRADANGVVTFVVGTKVATSVTDTAKVTQAKIEVTVAGTTTKLLGQIKFAGINITNATIDNVENDADDILTDNLVASTNSNLDPVSNTNNMTAGSVVYVNSQRVSATGVDHKVTFTAEPSLVIPTGFGAISTGDYVQPVAKKVAENYQPYASTTWTSEEIPAGLKYATLNFNRIQISQYSRVTIKTLNLAGTVLDTYTVNGQHDQANFGYQIKVQANTKTKVSVTLEAPGQVQTNMNAGLDIKNITGVYQGTGVVAASTVAMPDAKIEWATAPVVYSDIKYFSTNNGGNTVDPDAAAFNLATLLGAKYTADYVYSFQVPVFPQTGDAVIVGKDKNGVEKQYFLWPTINKPVVVGLVTTYQNINILKPIAGTEVAILSTKQEATTTTGTITQSGFSVTVDAKVVGSTNLVGTVSIPGLDSTVINATNNRIYTSVQWAPLPNAVAATTSNSFFALVGQTVTVKAQLTDVNGNPVAISGQPVAWKYDNQGTATAIAAVGALNNTLGASVVSMDTITDVNGQATIVLSSGSYLTELDGLTATSGSNYNISLKLGESTVTKAKLRWVAVGLDFAPVLPITPAPQYGAATTITTDAPVPSAGTPWLYGYRLYGAYGTAGTLTGNVTDDAKAGFTVEGVAINVASAAGSVGTVSTSANGIVSARSTQAGTTQLVGTIGQPNATVTFTISDVKYTSVGQGTPSLYSNVVLPVAWKTVGQNATVVLPAGTTIAATQNNTIAYVKVTDSLGNALVNTGVNYTITGVGAGAGAGTTDAYGVLAVTVANATNIAGQSTISVTVAGMTTALTSTINWVNAQGPALFLANIGLNATATNDKLVLTFSQPINPASVALGQFRVTDGTANYAVKEVTVSDNVVYLTMADSNAKLPQNKTYNVTFSASTATSGADAGIAKAICDNYGRTVSVLANVAALSVPCASDVTVTYNGVNTLTVTAKEANAAPVAASLVRLVSTDATLFTNVVVDGISVLEKGIGYIVVRIAGGASTATISLVGAPKVVSTVSAYYNGVSSAAFVNRSLADITSPTVLSAAFTNATTLRVVYSEAVNTVITDYTPGVVTPIAAGAVAFTISALTVVNSTTIDLTVAGTGTALVAGDLAQISIANVTDTAGNTITPVVNKNVTAFAN